jgi:hypothetical protein
MATSIDFFPNQFNEEESMVRQPSNYAPDNSSNYVSYDEEPPLWEGNKKFSDAILSHIN